MYHYKNKLSKRTNFIFMIISFILTVSELCFNYFYFNNTEVEYLVFTYVFSYFLFSFVVSIELKGNENTYFKLRTISSIVYFFHPLALNLVLFSPMHSIFKFLFVLLASALYCIVVFKYKKHNTKIILSIYSFIKEQKLIIFLYSHIKKQKSVIYLTSQFKNKAGL